VPCLGLKSRQGIVPLGVPGVQQLDRDWPGQDVVRRVPHFPVPAAADLLIKHVPSAEDRSSQGHRRLLPPVPDSNRRCRQAMLA
jgi:hypothetical protein